MFSGGRIKLRKYRCSISSSITHLGGFIFVESDRLPSLIKSTWNHALAEIEFLARMATCEPGESESERFEGSLRKYILGIVPWAAIPADLNVVEKYISLTT
jgi:hypothetical protein